MCVGQQPQPCHHKSIHLLQANGLSSFHCSFHGCLPRPSTSTMSGNGGEVGPLGCHAPASNLQESSVKRSFSLAAISSPIVPCPPMTTSRRHAREYTLPDPHSVVRLRELHRSGPQPIQSILLYLPIAAPRVLHERVFNGMKIRVSNTPPIFAAAIAMGVISRCRRNPSSGEDPAWPFDDKILSICKHAWEKDPPASDRGYSLQLRSAQAE